MKKKVIVFSILVAFLIILFTVSVSAACWQQVSESTCNGDSSGACTWKSDSWGGWCEELNCWSLYTQDECTDADTISQIGKNCTWQSGNTYASCEDFSCYSYDGTDESTCEDSTDILNLNCEWSEYCNGWSPATDCWSLSTEATCTNTTGCNWGSCYQVGCGTHMDQTNCELSTDYYRKNCTWSTDPSWNSGICQENFCENYPNQTACNAGTGGMDCNWDSNWQSCQGIWCNNYDYTNQSACESNTANISCSWDGTWCMEENCWNFDQTTCGEKDECNWASTSSGGWCEEVQCWSYDSWNGGNQSTCVNNNYGLSCTWGGSNPGNLTEGWCYYDTSSQACTDFTTERDCMDTYYCWWKYQDWSSPELGGNCSAPEWGTGDYSGTDTIFTEWNPGCYIFDLNSTSCNNIKGCTYNAATVSCDTDTSHAYASAIAETGLNCSMVNETQLCNSIPVLSSCCSYQNGTCTQNKFTSSCWDQMSNPPEGATFCEDYNSYTDSNLCNQIAADPWYMPCEWSNATERCQFKGDDAFINETQSIIKITNPKTCKSAGGVWIVENYCEGPYENISIPTGRCEYKFDNETSCDKACFACEQYTGAGYDDGAGNIVNASNAYEACTYSKLGYCEYRADTTAPNSVGFCTAKEEYQQGIAGNCNDDCGSCTYLGDKRSNDSTKRPQYYCEQSNANSASGGCKWTIDNTTTSGGYCLNKEDKTCEDACDRCYTKDKCQNTGRLAISNQTGSCKWSGTTSEGTCESNVAESVEVCWDGIDNDANNLVDCSDAGCYADPFCGFVSGTCNGWTDSATCTTNGCEWVEDQWGSWCDFAGSQCWKADSNSANCTANTACEWNAGTGDGWCETDWSIADSCMGQAYDTCSEIEACSWTNDTWCAGDGANTDWCQGNAGWCDHDSFASSNCWMYQAGSTECNGQSGCNWHIDEWASTQQCETNYSGNCWQYTDSTNCESNTCWWNSDWEWCGNLIEQCYQESTESTCNAVTSSGTAICNWRDEWGGMCEPKCYDISTSASCTTTPGCYWRNETGWCEDSFMGSCTGSASNNATGCDDTSGCRWRDSGWCDPKAGFSCGMSETGGGYGGAMGAECYKYDGNQSFCTNTTRINISCGWIPESNPHCEIDWGNVDCWSFKDNNTCENETAGIGKCFWFNESLYLGIPEGQQYCANVMDQCWLNFTSEYVDWKCNKNPKCRYNEDWNSCEPRCTNQTQSTCNNGCKWVDGWCNTNGMNDMFKGMDESAPTPIGNDDCNNEVTQASVDICSYGMKDSGDSYMFGVPVANVGNASFCYKEKISTFASGFASERTGAGNDTIKLVVYLDTDGTSTGGCALSHNSTATGYEFRFKYTSEWNSNTSKATESFNSYKCKGGDWAAVDIKLSAWKKKMCGMMGGPMIAVEKSELSRFPDLYNTSADMRINVATIGNLGNITSPTDSVDTAGWMTPGSMDFEIFNAFGIGGDGAKFEDILKKGYVEYENCFNGIDDDNDQSVDCFDWDCEYSSKCASTGVNAAGFVDTSTPLVTGVKIEEYYDSALVLYDTNKPTNGTLIFYDNDSTCQTINSTLLDIGITSGSVREHKVWHKAEIYSGTIDTGLLNQTTYYYKLKVCDTNGKCAQSRCSSVNTTSSTKCGYCDFVTRIKAPTGWDVYYDINQNGSYSHYQGNMCGANAGMKTNYSAGRYANIKLEKSDGTIYFEFINASLTKSALNDKVRTIDTTGDLIGTSEYAGLTSETRDKIINNLHPEVCNVKIPFSGTCDTLYHCDEAGINCEDRTAEANLTDSTNCIWQIPFCEFSTYAEVNNPGATTTTTTSSSSGGTSGGAGGGFSSNETEEEEEETTERAVEEPEGEVIGEGEDALAEGAETTTLGDVTKNPWLWLVVVAGVVVILLVALIRWKTKN